jgi:hypothetical protein
MILLRSCEPFDRTKIRCPKPAKKNVYETVLVAGGLLRRCIALKPINPVPLILHFNDVLLGEAIQGNFGIDDTAYENDVQKRITLSVSVDGVSKGSFEGSARPSWVSWRVATLGRTGTRGHIAVRIDANFEDDYAFCFTGYASKPLD